MRTLTMHCEEEMGRGDRTDHLPSYSVAKEYILEEWFLLAKTVHLI